MAYHLNPHSRLQRDQPRNLAQDDRVRAPVPASRVVEPRRVNQDKRFTVETGVDCIGLLRACGDMSVPLRPIDFLLGIYMNPVVLR
jgi:hypothetical protein